MKRWKTWLKLVWYTLLGHPKTTQVATQLVSNKLELQPARERIELEKLQANSMLLRGRMTIEFGHINGLVMVYLSEFTLNFAMNSEQLDWFIAGLRAEQEKLKNEASTG